MASGSAYFDDVRVSPEVIDPPSPRNDDNLEVIEHVVGDHIRHSPKSNVVVASNVRELLECPVCLNAMYPPIHQVSYLTSHLFSYSSVSVNSRCYSYFFSPFICPFSLVSLGARFFQKFKS